MKNQSRVDVTDTSSARQYLVQWMQEYFPTDKTFSAYILADLAARFRLAAGQGAVDASEWYWGCGNARPAAAPALMPLAGLSQFANGEDTDQPAQAVAARVWREAIEAAAHVVIKHTRVPRDLLGPAPAAMKAAAKKGEMIAATIRALPVPVPERVASPTAALDASNVADDPKFKEFIDALLSEYWNSESHRAAFAEFINKRVGRAPEAALAHQAAAPLREASQSPATSAADAMDAERDLRGVPSSLLMLELTLRDGPRFKCQSTDCGTYHQSPGKWDTCPSCGRKGYLCGGFEKDRQSPQWRALAHRKIDTAASCRSTTAASRTNTSPRTAQSSSGKPTLNAIATTAWRQRTAAMATTARSTGRRTRHPSRKRHNRKGRRDAADEGHAAVAVGQPTPYRRRGRSETRAARAEAHGDRGARGR